MADADRRRRASASRCAGARRSASAASHFTAADLTAARHTNELEPRPEVLLSLDHAQRGLGTASCGPDTRTALPPARAALLVRLRAAADRRCRAADATATSGEQPRRRPVRSRYGARHAPATSSGARGRRRARGPSRRTRRRAAGRRTPRPPGELDEQVELGDRDLVVVAEARVALEQQPARRGEVSRSSAAAKSRTRWFSVCTWRTRDVGRCPPRERPAAAAHQPDVSWLCSDCAPSRRRRAPPRPARRRAGTRASRSRAGSRGPRGRAAHAAWSRIPHGTPTARSSARWQASASSSGSSSKPATAQSASPTATSSAAEDERPRAGRQVGAHGSREADRRPPERVRARRRPPAHSGPSRRRAAPLPSAANGAAPPKRSETSDDLAAPRARPRARPRTGSQPAARARRCSRCARRSG